MDGFAFQRNIDSLDFMPSPLFNADALITFSIVCPVYGVESYLPQFLESLSSQEPGPYSVECVFVDDGSPDGSAELIAHWLAGLDPATGMSGQLLKQANLGPGPARNLGLGAATGTWIGFPDPDDVLATNYFAAVAQLIRSNRTNQPSVVVPRLVDLRDDGTEVVNQAVEPLFMGGSRVVALAFVPNAAPSSASRAFFQRNEIERQGLRFSSRIRHGEDKLFCGMYMAGVVDPTVGLVADTYYLYRRRVADKSLTGLYWQDASLLRQTLLEVAHPLLSLFSDRSVPQWLANGILTDLKWVLQAQRDVERRAKMNKADRLRYLGELKRVMRLIPPAFIEAYQNGPMPLQDKVFLLALNSPALIPAEVLVISLNSRRSCGEFRIFTSDSNPNLEVVAGERLTALLEKVTEPLRYFEQEEVYVTDFTVAMNGPVRVYLDGRPLPLLSLRQAAPLFELVAPMPPPS